VHLGDTEAWAVNNGIAILLSIQSQLGSAGHVRTRLRAVVVRMKPAAQIQEQLHATCTA